MLSTKRAVVSLVVKLATNAALGALCLTLFWPSEILGQTILYGTDAGSDALYTIDPTTGVINLIGRLDSSQPNQNLNRNRFATPVAMAVRQSDGTIFVWNNSSCEGTPGTVCENPDIMLRGELVTIDPSTGAATPVSPSFQAVLGSLAYNPVSDELYGLDTVLYSIDPSNGVATLVAPIRNVETNLLTRIGAAEFDACGVLYGVGFDRVLYVIDTASGYATPIGALHEGGVPVSSGIIGSIVFAPDGSLIGTRSGLGLFFIDTGTAEISNFRGLFGPQGLGFVTDTPATCNAGPIPTDIDIKPGSFPNSVNLCSNGVVPVAILGSETLDVSTLDPDTLRVGDSKVQVAGRAHKDLCHLEDVSGDFGTPEFPIPEGSPDGYLDLVCQVPTVELGDVLDGTSLELIVWVESFEGENEYRGSDSVRIVKDCPQ